MESRLYSAKVWIGSESVDHLVYIPISVDLFVDIPKMVFELTFQNLWMPLPALQIHSR